MRELLKLLALASMTLDHVNAALLARAIESLTVIGRIAFPVFVFAAAAGALHTTNGRHYLGRLLLCAIVAQPFFWLALNTDWWYLNTVFTLFWGVLSVLAWRGAGRPWLVPLLWLPAVASDYGVAGAAAVFAAALLLEGERNRMLAGAIMLTLAAPLLWPRPQDQIVGLIACLLTVMLLRTAPSASAWRLPKGLFYVYYPLHLALLWMLAALLLG